MKPLQQKILTEAKEWGGTPWQHNQISKGKGCDCIRFPFGVAINVGIKLIDPGNYSRHAQGEKLLHKIDEQRELFLVGVVDGAYGWSQKYLMRSLKKEALLKIAEPADILVYKRMAATAPPGHLAIKTEAGKIHCSQRHGVVESSMGEAHSLCAIYRFWGTC